MPLLPSLIERSNKVALLTLCTSSDLLLQRINARLASIQLTSYAPDYSKIEHINRLQKKSRLYRDNNYLIGEYDKWKQFVRSFTLEKHLLLDSMKSENKLAERYEDNKVKEILSHNTFY